MLANIHFPTHFQDNKNHHHDCQHDTITISTLQKQAKRRSSLKRNASSLEMFLHRIRIAKIASGQKYEQGILKQHFFISKLIHCSTQESNIEVKALLILSLTDVWCTFFLTHATLLSLTVLP